jgi:hypothetical protein
MAVAMEKFGEMAGPKLGAMVNQVEKNKREPVQGNGYDIPKGYVSIRQNFLSCRNITFRQNFPSCRNITFRRHFPLSHLPSTEHT